MEISDGDRQWDLWGQEKDKQDSSRFVICDTSYIWGDHGSQGQLLLNAPQGLSALHQLFLLVWLEGHVDNIRQAAVTQDARHAEEDLFIHTMHSLWRRNKCQIIVLCSTVPKFSRLITQPTSLDIIGPSKLNYTLLDNVILA